MPTQDARASLVRPSELTGRCARQEVRCEVRQRLDAVPPYLFAELERKIAEKRREGVDVISLGIGDPDLPTPQPVIDALAEGARDPAHAPVPDEPRLRRVPRGGGRLLPRALRRRARPGLRDRPRARRQGGRRPHRAGAARPGRRLPLARSRATRPTRPARCSRARRCTTCRSSEANGFLPDLDAIPADVLARANLLFLDYPNNPTGAVVEPGYFERAVEFARANDLVVVHDNAYSEICFDGYRAPSFLETPGAKEVGVEIFSLSKGWNMTGWRSGPRRGQRGGRRALPAAEDEPRLGDVRGGPARDGRRAHRGARLPARDVGGLRAAARPRGRGARARSGSRSTRRRRRRTSGCASRRATPRRRSPSSCSRRQAWSSRRGRRTGRAARGSSASRSPLPDERLEEAVRRIESSLRSGIIQA